MNTEKKNRYFQELALNLQHDGFTVKPETEDGLLPVELDGQRLCLALDTGAVRYRSEDAADGYRSAALDHRQNHCRVYESDGGGAPIDSQRPDRRLQAAG